MLNQLEKQFAPVAAENGVVLHIEYPKDMPARNSPSSDELHTLLSSLIALGLKCAIPGSDVCLQFQIKKAALHITLSLHSNVEIDFLKSLLENRLKLIQMEHVPLYIQVSGNMTTFHLDWDKNDG